MTYKDHQDLWISFWRMPDLSVLVLDPDGTVLCDSSTKEPDGTDADPVKFLNDFAVIAKNIREGKGSVQNPLISIEAFDKFLAGQLAQKTTSDRPSPIIMDFSGIDPASMALMEGHDYVITIEVGADGLAHNLTVVKGGDFVAEKALRQASSLWMFQPAFKDGVPVAKKIGIPIRIKAPAKAPEAK